MADPRGGPHDVILSAYRPAVPVVCGPDGRSGRAARAGAMPQANPLAGAGGLKPDGRGIAVGLEIGSADGRSPVPRGAVGSPGGPVLPGAPGPEGPGPRGPAGPDPRGPVDGGRENVDPGGPCPARSRARRPAIRPRGYGSIAARARSAAGGLAFRCGRRVIGGRPGPAGLRPAPAAASAKRRRFSSRGMLKRSRGSSCSPPGRQVGPLRSPPGAPRAGRAFLFRRGPELSAREPLELMSACRASSWLNVGAAPRSWRGMRSACLRG